LPAAAAITLPVPVILNRFLAADLVFILGILLLLNYNPCHICDTPRLLFKSPSCAALRVLFSRRFVCIGQRLDFTFRPTKARKAYKTATACPAGRFEQRFNTHKHSKKQL
jgi:hypothetical protein